MKMTAYPSSEGDSKQVSAKFLSCLLKALELTIYKDKCIHMRGTVNGGERDFETRISPNRVAEFARTLKQYLGIRDWQVDFDALMSNKGIQVFLLARSIRLRSNHELEGWTSETARSALTVIAAIGCFMQSQDPRFTIVREMTKRSIKSVPLFLSTLVASLFKLMLPAGRKLSLNDTQLCHLLLQINSPLTLCADGGVQFNDLVPVTMVECVDCNTEISSGIPCGHQWILHPEAIASFITFFHKMKYMNPNQCRFFSVTDIRVKLPQTGEAIVLALASFALVVDRLYGARTTHHIYDDLHELLELRPENENNIDQNRFKLYECPDRISDFAFVIFVGICRIYRLRDDLVRSITNEAREFLCACQPTAFVSLGCMLEVFIAIQSIKGRNFPLAERFERAVNKIKLL